MQKQVLNQNNTIVETGFKPVATKLKMNNNKFQGKYRIDSIRLNDFDYSKNGAYFVTICTRNNEYILGNVNNQLMNMTRQGEIVKECWLALPLHYCNCTLDEFIVMPNHVHGVVIINNDIIETSFKQDNIVAETGLKPDKVVVETGLKPVSTAGRVAKPYSLSEIIRGFKTFSARKVNEYQNTRGKPFWQERFYDRIVRNEEELNRIRRYIVENPLKWELEKNNPENICVETGLKPVSTIRLQKQGNFDE